MQRRVHIEVDYPDTRKYTMFNKLFEYSYHSTTQPKLPVPMYLCTNIPNISRKKSSLHNAMMSIHSCKNCTQESSLAQTNDPKYVRPRFNDCSQQACRSCYGDSIWLSSNTTDLSGGAKYAISPDHNSIADNHFAHFGMPYNSSCAVLHKAVRVKKVDSQEYQQQPWTVVVGLSFSNAQPSPK